ncbi:MAG: 2-hydroxyacid dehydrogenase [Xanthobacteraceae bacterium]|nr:2-hydroxyacid dehydrogenase [Xanthobacteraceae bacterium]MBY0611662.1 2-hydroxyacid dehydrogenase [Beijerinckiaceae bacterium]
MPHKIIINSRFLRGLQSRIGERYDLLHLGFDEMAAGALPPEALACRAVVTMGAQRFDGALMDRLPDLGAIVCYGTGYDGVDLKAAQARGIAVANSPGANAAAVADLAMALMLSVTRSIVPAHAYVASGGWAAAAPSPVGVAAPGLAGKRLGIYGMGEIGRKIALRAAAFEMEIAYTGRRPHIDLDYRFHADLAGLAEWADILVVAVRAGASTHHAVDGGMLAKLGPKGFVINISRGSVIDEIALAAAIETKAIAGAGLDVFETEPVKTGALTRLSNVVLTPHIGGHTEDAHLAMQRCVLANLDAFFAGATLPYQVSVE